jgi:uncharacterized lipoprotein YmbA
MRVACYSVIALLLIGGCSTTKTATLDPAQQYTYMLPAQQEAQCETLITIGGGLKTKCTQ